MKYLVVRICDNDIEEYVGVRDSLDSVIRFVKELCEPPFYGDKFRIYSLSSFLTVRYLDNKIFFD